MHNEQLMVDIPIMDNNYNLNDMWVHRPFELSELLGQHLFKLGMHFFKIGKFAVNKGLKILSSQF
jgi:hypothetical protein